MNFSKILTAADKYLTAAVKLFENFTVAGFFLYGKNIFWVHGSGSEYGWMFSP
jgi:hypothetical protein